jgi:hypothetical protein
MSPRTCQESQWLQWLHSAFARARCRSLALSEAAANRWFQRTHANGRERPPAFAMQKVVGSSPIIRSKERPWKQGLSSFLGSDFDRAVEARFGRFW